MTKFHRLDGLNNRYLFPHNSRGRVSIIKLQTNLAFVEGSLPCLWMGVSLYGF